jgi:hypothetical protein
VRISGRKNQHDVIPAKAGLSTAELVIHLDLASGAKSKWIPAFAGMTAKFGSSVVFSLAQSLRITISQLHRI